jgi:hypothetical protein
MSHTTTTMGAYPDTDQGGSTASFDARNFGKGRPISEYAAEVRQRAQAEAAAQRAQDLQQYPGLRRNQGGDGPGVTEAALNAAIAQEAANQGNGLPDYGKATGGETSGAQGQGGTLPEGFTRAVSLGNPNQGQPYADVTYTGQGGSTASFDARNFGEDRPLSEYAAEVLQRAGAVPQGARVDRPDLNRPVGPAGFTVGDMARANKNMAEGRRGAGSFSVVSGPASDTPGYAQMSTAEQIAANAQGYENAAKAQRKLNRLDAGLPAEPGQQGAAAFGRGVTRPAAQASGQDGGGYGLFSNAARDARNAEMEAQSVAGGVRGFAPGAGYYRASPKQQLTSIDQRLKERETTARKRDNLASEERRAENRLGYDYAALNQQDRKDRRQTAAARANDARDFTIGQAKADAQLARNMRLEEYKAKVGDKGAGGDTLKQVMQGIDKLYPDLPGGDSTAPARRALLQSLAGGLVKRFPGKWNQGELLGALQAFGAKALTADEAMAQAKAQAGWGATEQDLAKRAQELKAQSEQQATAALRQRLGLGG